MDRKQRMIAGGVALLVVVVVGIIAVLALDDDDDDGTTTGGEQASTIVADDLSFQPPTTTVAEGSEVEFRNDDTLPHTFTADDGLFDSGTVDAGDAYRFTFDSAGQITYHCEIHPAMTGTITVE